MGLVVAHILRFEISARITYGISSVEIFLGRGKTFRVKLRFFCKVSMAG